MIVVVVICDCLVNLEGDFIEKCLVVGDAFPQPFFLQQALDESHRRFEIRLRLRSRGLVKRRQISARRRVSGAARSLRLDVFVEFGKNARGGELRLDATELPLGFFQLLLGLYLRGQDCNADGI